MNCLKRKVWSVFAVIAVMVFTNSYLQAGEPSAATYKGVLPGDAIIHIKTSGIDNTIANVESFLTQAGQGTPLAMQLQPGMIKQMLLMKLAALQVNLLDMNQPIHFIITAPKLGEEPPVALLLPLPGIKNKINLLKNGGFTVKEPETGVYELTAPVNPGEPFYLSACGDNYACLSNLVSSARHIADIAGSLVDKPAKNKPTSASLILTVDVAKIMSYYNTFIEAMLVKFEQDAQTGNLQGMDDAPKFGREMLKISPKYLRKLVDFAKEIKSSRTYLYLSDAALRTSTYFTPKADTAFARFTAAYDKCNPTYTNAQYLPEKAVLVECVHHDQEALKELGKVMVAAFSDFGSTLHPKAGQDLAAALERMLDIGVGQGALAVIPDKAKDAGPDQQCMIMYYKVKDGTAYKKVISDALTAFSTLLSEIYAQMNIPMPIKMNLRLKENATTIEGLPVDQVMFDMQIDKNNPQLGGPGGDMVKKMKEMAKNWQQSICIMDNTVILASGPNANTRLAEAIKALRNKKIGLGKDKHFVESLDSTKNKQILFATIHLIDWLKLVTAQALAMNPMVPDPVKKIIAGLPNSTKTMSLAIGTKPGRVKQNGKNPASVWMVMRVPSEAIAEIAQAGMRAFMQFQMMQNNAMPPPANQPKAPEDKPVEAF